MKKSTAILALLAASLLWSTGGFLIKSVHWHPLAISGMRSLIAALFLTAVLRPKQLRLSPAVLGGALAYAATVTLVVVATRLTTAANAIFLQYTSPFYVAIFGIWFLGERPSRADWGALLVIFGGMSLFFFEELDPSGRWGIFAALGAGVGFAWLTLFLRKQKDADPVVSIVLGNYLAALVGLPFMFGALPDPAGWLALGLLGVAQIGLPYWLYALAIRRVSAIEAVLLVTLEPVLNPLWVFLLLGEIPGYFTLAGGMVIIGTVTLRAVLPLRGTAAVEPRR
jgi:drug/metabolite transporter (DMT)-like permease